MCLRVTLSIDVSTTDLAFSTCCRPAVGSPLCNRLRQFSLFLALETVTYQSIVVRHLAVSFQFSVQEAVHQFLDQSDVILMNDEQCVTRVDHYHAL